MAKKNGEFLKKLLATFRVEADEHLKAMSSSLLELEKAPAGARRLELVETIFREAHSLKGAARAVNFADIESVCQSLESVFAGMKSGAEASAQLFDLLHQALDALGGLLAPEPAAAKPALCRAASATMAPGSPRAFSGALLVAVLSEGSVGA